MTKIKDIMDLAVAIRDHSSLIDNATVETMLEACAVHLYGTRPKLTMTVDFGGGVKTTEVISAGMSSD